MVDRDGWRVGGWGVEGGGGAEAGVLDSQHPLTNQTIRDRILSADVYSQSVLGDSACVFSV